MPEAIPIVELLFQGSTWADLDSAVGPVQWDWPGWLPRGFLTILASEPGIGKSSLCLRIAASYLDGRPWPDGSEFTAGSGRVLWCESEGSHLINLDRARRWRLDPTRIISPLGASQRNFHLDKPSHLLALLLPLAGDDVNLVIFDSLGGLHSRGRNAALSGKLVTTLASVARAIRKPVLLTHHLRKGASRDRDGRLTLDRLLGSSAITQVARVVWALDVPNLADPETCCLSVIKNNLTPIPQPIGMKIREQGLQFGPAPQPPATQGSQLDRAITFLTDLLAGGDPLPAKQLTAECQAAGLSERTMHRAKKLLRIRSIRPPGKADWYWTLPPPPEDD